MSRAVRMNGPNQLMGDDNDNVLTGGAVNDTINGMGGDDVIDWPVEGLTRSTAVKAPTPLLLMEATAFVLSTATTRSQRF